MSNNRIQREHRAAQAAIAKRRSDAILAVKESVRSAIILARDYPLILKELHSAMLEIDIELYGEEEEE